MTIPAPTAVDARQALVEAIADCAAAAKETARADAALTLAQACEHLARAHCMMLGGGES